jgi:predicted RNase H-like HicB family nuclease
MAVQASNVVGYITLTGFVEEEDPQFVSYCPQLGVSSCGDSVEEALANLEEATDVQLESLIATGELIRELRLRNVRIDLEPTYNFFINLPPGAARRQIFTAYHRQVPARQPVAG